MLTPIVVLALIATAIFLFLEYAGENNLNDKPKESFQMIKAGSGIAYKMHEDLKDPILAADTMDKLNANAHLLINHLYTNYINGTAISDIKSEHRQNVIDSVLRLKKKFKTASMEENIPSRSGGDTSYVLNKGDVMALCLRDPKNENNVDDDFNMMNFVLIHEMSHIADRNYGHERSFWNIFRFILSEGVKIGLHHPINYRKYPTGYCGIQVSYSPLYDIDLDSFYT